MPARIPKEEWLRRAAEVHGAKYDYSLVQWETTRKRVEIVCPTHGSFLQTPVGHLCGGCRKCGREIYAKRHRKPLDRFIEDAVAVHGCLYNYSLVGQTYKNNRSMVSVICSKHGPFVIKAFNHVTQGTGCGKCSGRVGREGWIERAVLVHGDKYDYSLVDYKGCETKIEIVCKRHGSFIQMPFSHLQLHGCPSCNGSTGETRIFAHLQASGVKFQAQKTFSDCKGRLRPLPFDFYLPDFNLVIEYQGRQHFESGSWGGDEGLAERQRLDSIKKNYCIEKDLKLLEIRFDEDVTSTLDRVLGLK